MKKDGTPVDNGTDYSIVNLFPHSLFSQVDLEIDGVNLSSQDNLYPYKAYLESLLTYGHDAKFSHLTTEHFVKDTAGQFESGSSGNHGYVTRKKDVLDSKLFDFCIIPHIDFLHTPRILPSGVGMKLKLTRNNDAFSILSSASIDLSVKIHSLNLLVYRMQPSVALLRLHEKIFSSKNALFPVTKSVCRKYTVPAGLSSANTPNIIHGTLPRQIVIGFVLADALNGDYSLNPFHFNHFNCISIALRVNGEQIPSKGYRPNFEKRIVRRELRALYDNIGINSPGDNVGCEINVDDFVGGYTLFCFDLTPDRCNGYHLHENVSGIVDIEILFSKPLDKAITVICYSAFECVVALTKERNIFIGD